MENLDRKKLYKAMLARDPRNDGRFYVGVRTTGIYCRPICPAKPKLENIDFYKSKAEAENAGFRPCLRCRPDLSPLSPQWRGTAAIVSRALKLIELGASEEQDLETIAGKLGMTDRHLRRLFKEHVGASPIEVVISRRLHLARQLLGQTSLSITEIAFASGFNSSRRFNDAFVKTYRTHPRDFRKTSTRKNADESLSVELPYVAPFPWDQLLDYFRRHAVPGVEVVDDVSYSRHFKTPRGMNHFQVTHDPKGSQLRVKLRLADLSELGPTIDKIRRLFDLAHNPHSLEIKPRKTFDVHQVRIPGCFDGFESAVGVILGQLVTVEQGQRNMGKLVEAFGEREGNVQLFPTAKVLAAADLSNLGFTKVRAESIKVLARMVEEKEIDLTEACDLIETRSKLLAVKGIGPWTVEMIALRCLCDTDAFPATDLIIQRALEKFKLDAEAYSPWRAYLSLAIWKSQAGLLTKKRKK